MIQAPVIDRLWTPEEVRRVLDAAAEFMGADFPRLMKRHRAGLAATQTPPSVQHPLALVVDRLEKALVAPEGSIEESLAAVGIAELDAELGLFGRWSSNHAWIQYRPSIVDPRAYLHGVATLAIAEDLQIRHDKVELVAFGSKRSGDLKMIVSDDKGLIVEVKAPLSLHQRDSALQISEAMGITRTLVHKAGTGVRGQMAELPATLVISASDLGDATIQAMTTGIELVLQGDDGRRRPNLMGVVLAQTQNRFEFKGPRFSILTQRHSRLRRNPHYAGPLRLVGDWSEAWRLV